MQEVFDGDFAHLGDIDSAGEDIVHCGNDSGFDGDPAAFFEDFAEFFGTGVRLADDGLSCLMFLCSFSELFDASENGDTGDFASLYAWVIRDESDDLNAEFGVRPDSIHDLFASVSGTDDECAIEGFGVSSGLFERSFVSDAANNPHAQACEYAEAQVDADDAPWDDAVSCPWVGCREPDADDMDDAFGDLCDNECDDDFSGIREGNESPCAVRRADEVHCREFDRQQERQMQEHSCAP